MRLPEFPKVETLKAVAVYGIAAYIVVKALGMLSDMVASGAVDGAAALGIIGALVATVAAFLFGVEQGKQQQKAFEAGVNTTPAGTTVTNADTVQAGGPTTVNPT